MTFFLQFILYELTLRDSLGAILMLTKPNFNFGFNYMSKVRT